MSKNIKICILSEYAYFLIKGENTRIGGAELQMVLLAKELIKKSYDVSFVTFEKTNNDFEKIGKLKIYNPFDIKKKGFNSLGKDPKILAAASLYFTAKEDGLKLTQKQVIEVADVSRSKTSKWLNQLKNFYFKE